MTLAPHLKLLPKQCGGTKAHAAPCCPGFPGWPASWPSGFPPLRQLAKANPGLSVLCVTGENGLVYQFYGQASGTSSIYAQLPCFMMDWEDRVGGERTTRASTASFLKLRRANARRPLTQNFRVQLLLLYRRQGEDQVWGLGFSFLCITGKKGNVRV